MTTKKAIAANTGLEPQDDDNVTSKLPVVPGAEDIDQPGPTAARRIVRELNLDRTLKWTDVETLEQVYALIEYPPFRSVVAEISPAVASELLRRFNTQNRPLLGRYAQHIGIQLGTDDFSLTGDTVKFSKSGRMLDGQHRLEACRTSRVNLTTHIVFGLDDAIFDIIDQGRKRTPGEILALVGLKDYNIVAGAVRLAYAYSRGKTTTGGGGHALTVRKIRELATGPMRDITEWTQLGRLVHAAYGVAPSTATAVLYMIGQHSKTLAREFGETWTTGNKLGRNQNFAVLQERLIEIRKHTGGHLNRHLLAAMIIQMFNHWNANVVAKARALVWRSSQTFPALEFDTNSFLQKREQERIGDTSLPASMDRMLVALGRFMNGSRDGNVEKTIEELSVKAQIPRNQTGYVLDEMVKHGFVHKVRARSPVGPAIWRVKDQGLARLRELSRTD